MIPRPILLLLIPFLLSGFLTGCATLGSLEQPPRVSLSKLQPLDMTLFEQRYRLSLRIQNPNKTSLPIEGMNYEVYLNGRKFASGVSNQAVTVPGFGETLVDVDVVSNVLRLFQQLQTLGSDNTRKLDWKISGSLALTGFLTQIPFEYEGELDISPSKPPTTAPAT